MKTTRNSFALLTLGTALLVSAAQAQAPGGPPAAGAPAGAPGAAGAAGSATTVTNDQTTVTTTEDTFGGEAGTELTAEPLPDTGGAPLAMAIGGAIIAAGSLLLRRKLV